MDLKNKTDKKLKRYLNSICESKKESKIYNSIHYLISVNNVIKHIRFSNHLSSRSSDLFIDIIKVSSDYYQIWFDNGCKYVVEALNLVDYIKGYILVYNLVNEENHALKDALQKAEREIVKLNKSEIVKENKSLLEQLQEKNQKIRDLETTLSNKNSTIKQLNYRIDQYGQFHNRIKKLKNFLNDFND